jgi:hypothetical protein
MPGARQASSTEHHTPQHKPVIVTRPNK